MGHGPAYQLAVLSTRQEYAWRRDTLQGITDLVWLNYLRLPMQLIFSVRPSRFLPDRMSGCCSATTGRAYEYSYAGSGGSWTT